jgi:hypothetical protein
MTFRAIRGCIENNGFIFSPFPLNFCLTRSIADLVFTALKKLTTHDNGNPVVRSGRKAMGLAEIARLPTVLIPALSGEL